MLPQTGERQVAEDLKGIKPNHIQRYQFAIDKIKEKHGDKLINILDAACGVGYGTNMIANQIDCSAMGLDIFEGAIESANRAYKIENNKYLQCDLGDEENWPFSDTHFDAIVSIETIEHVEDAESLIKRFAESTDFLIASVPNQDVVPFKKDVHPFHFRHYTNSEFEELLNKYGFYIEAIGTQYDKYPGLVYEGDDGYGNIVSAVKK